jgi:hypothetical protein
MRAPRGLKITLITVGGAVGLFLLLFGKQLLLVSTGHSDTRVKKTSAIYIPAITLWPSDTWEQRIRDAVLQQLPIGSTPQQIQAFLEQHFDRVQYRIAQSEDERVLRRFSEPHIFIRAIDDRGYPGECRVEIYLLLTPDERLRDVAVRAIQGYV